MFVVEFLLNNPIVISVVLNVIFVVVLVMGWKSFRHAKQDLRELRRSNNVNASANADWREETRRKTADLQSLFRERAEQESLYNAKVYKLLRTGESHGQVNHH